MRIIVTEILYRQTRQRENKGMVPPSWIWNENDTLKEMRNTFIDYGKMVDLTKTILKPNYFCNGYTTHFGQRTLFSFSY